MKNNLVYSLGHSNISLEEFIKILKNLKVEYILDVRSNPVSSYVSHFNKDNLEKELINQDIQYLFLGDTLGGRQNVAYQKYCKTEVYQKNIKLLENIIQQGISSLMCSEKEFKECHRRFICETLINDGFNVVQYKVDERSAKKQVQVSLLNGGRK